MLRGLYVPGLAAFTLVLLPAPVHAHDLIVKCELIRDQVLVKAVFSDGKPAREALARVFRDDQQIVAEGRTDDHGQWSLPRPLPGRYEVVVDAGDGHLKKAVMT